MTTSEPTGTPPRWPAALAVGVCAVGFAVSSYLIHVHHLVHTGAAVTGFCDLSATVNCAGAARSAFSSIAGVPIALLGLAWYVVAAALALVGVGTGRSANTARRLLALGSVAGVAYSIVLAAVSVLIVKSVCPACIALYAVNVVLVVAALALWKAHRGASVGHSPVPPLAAGAAFAAIVAAGVLLAPAPPARELPSVDELRGPPLTSEQLAQLRLPSGPSRGPDDAALVFVEFSDFQCPYCGILTRSLHEVEPEYEGRLRVEFRQYPLSFHEHAHGAAIAAVCAHRQGRFWELHDLMFADQTGLAADGLREKAAAAGLDLDAYDACIGDPSADAEVSGDQAAGAAVGVAGTPAFYVNGTPYGGGLPPELLREIFDAELAKLEP
ncbi:MAG: thioredoxin domain-containing protein [Myxococcales bacterium]|nr:thioredoxin domain-containing protein [Myxococcales bacterium]MCB9520948.1 thioredoxin domain-containing protein [Myxococcales bacterium]MCB9531688.1 thioredoxin domain-containing protein [Myxococcales bacterium]MCB9534425.1 thioredoxin domain-containing protein [Myxococcales bacterium]